MAEYGEGKSIEELMNIPQEEWEGLSKKDMRSVVQRLASAANKRVDRMQKKGISSPALRQLLENGGRVSTKGKDLAALRAEFTRAKNFLQSQTSTISGYNEFVQNNIDALNEHGVDIDKKNFEDFWRVFDRLKEMDPSVENSALKYKIMQAIADEFDEDDIDVDYITERMMDQIDLLYEDYEEIENQKWDEFNDLMGDEVDSYAEDGDLFENYFNGDEDGDLFDDIDDDGSDEDGDNSVLYPDIE